MEEEHNQMGDVKHLHAQRAEVRDKIRLLDQDVERLHVRRFFYSAHPHLNHFCTIFPG